MLDHSLEDGKSVRSGEAKTRNPTGVSFASGLQLEGISFSTPDKHILTNVDLQLSQGEILCLLGPSGCGKTTLLRIVAGLLRQSKGTISLDQRLIADDSHFTMPEMRGIGLVFQDFALFPHLTIRQNVEYGLTALSKKDATRQADLMLERVGLLARASRYPDVLSGGEQQRVALARALAPRPSVILMDEPFSGLDSRLRDTVRQECLDLLRETRSTAVIVTHDAEEALRVGDKIALLKDGQLVQYGSGRDLYSNPVNMFAAGFFSEINTIPVTATEYTAQSIFGDKQHDFGNRLDTMAALRQNDVTVVPYSKSKSGLPGRVVSRRFLGTADLLVIRVEGLNLPVRAKVGAGTIDPNNELVLIQVDANDLMLFAKSNN